ncbi:MAG: hypothetical protein EP346_00105 [Bacteroidetes bacterium]|nr:MAG: hypothetical protein EP346_00105 [Bacteroidota bacterium]
MSIINANGTSVIAEITKSSTPVASAGLFKAPSKDGCLLMLKSDGLVKYRMVGNDEGVYDESYFYKGDISNIRVAEVLVDGTDAEFKFVW